MRLAARRLLQEAGLDREVEEGLYVALWRSSADACLRSHGRRHFTPPVLESQAVLVALHPEGMEAVLAPGADGKERLSLAVGNVVLTARQVAGTGALRWSGTRREAYRGAQRREVQRLLLKENRGRNNQRRRVSTPVNLRSSGALRCTWKPTWGRPLRELLLRPTTRPQPLLG